MKENIELEEAIELLLTVVKPITASEEVPLGAAVGRTLIQDLTADLPLPPFDRAAMDGYAVKRSDLGSLPCSLPVVGEEDAGAVYEGDIPVGSALRIMTGAPIPEGLDLVVPQEETDYGCDRVLIRSCPSRSNITPLGADVSLGALLYPAGTVLSPAAIALLAAEGFAFVPVVRKPRVLVLATGDEVVRPGTVLAPGKIYDSNAALLCSLLPAFGAEVAGISVLPDEPSLIERAIEDACKGAASPDLILTTGGVSVGVKDIFHSVYPKMGIDLLFWKVRVKPGMPVMAGTWNGIPVVSLSGNPYGVFAHAYLLVRPLIERFLHRSGALSWVQVTLSSAYGRGKTLRRFVRARVKESSGRLEGFVLAGGSGSSLLSDLAFANALVEIPEGVQNVDAGTKVRALLL